MRAMTVVILATYCLSSNAQLSQPPPIQAVVPPIDPEKAAVIRQIVDLTTTPDLRREVTALVLQQQATRLGLNSTYPSGYINDLQGKFRDNLSSLDLMPFIAPIYARSFSLAELQEVLAFRKSAAWRKLNALQIEMYSGTMAAVAKWAQDSETQWKREILAVHPEYTQQLQQQQQDKHQAQVVETLESPGNGVTAPQVLTKTQPAYTEAASRAKVEGSVSLSLVVGTDGKPRDIRVLTPLGFGLDEQAITAVGLWRFKPALKEGLPVAVSAKVSVSFEILPKRSQE